MKNILLYILLAVCLMALTSCGYKTPQTVSIDAKPFVTKFEALIGKKITFSISLTEIDRKWAGVCYIYSDGTREVQLSNYWWGEMGEDGKEQTVFHELGHCELGRGHIADLVNEVPISIMYPTAFGDQSYYADNRQAYIDELINNRVYEYEAVASTRFGGDYQPAPIKQAGTWTVKELLTIDNVLRYH